MIVLQPRFEAAVRRVQMSTDLTVDLETSGLRPYLGDRLVGIAVEDQGEAMYFPFRHGAGENLPEALLPPLLQAIVRPARRIGGHNLIRFDLPMIAREDEQLARTLLYSDAVPAWDTMIEAMLSDENEPSFSLEALGSKYLGGGAEKHARNKELVDRIRARYPRLRSPRELKAHLWELPAEEVAAYACGDCLDARALHKLYVPHLEQWGLTALAAEYARYARLLARIERTGLLIDRDECERRIAGTQTEQALVLAAIRREAGATFNPGSWQQVTKLCGTPDAQSETLARSGHPLAQRITLYKQLGKVRSTYYESILAALDTNRTIHPQLNLTRNQRDVGGARSGRLSCSNPNFQNLPKRADTWFMRVRELVLARPGKTLLAFDYERAEMWLGGHYSGDQALAQAYYQGRDLYAELAQGAGVSRTDAKIAWLAIQYGAGAWRLMQNFGWDEGKAQSVIDWFRRLCPSVQRMMWSLRDQAEATRCLRLWTGRVRHFDGERSRPFTAWNAIIQGGVAEMVRLAMQRPEPELDRLGAEMLLQVHDEILVETPTEAVAETVRVVRRTMEDFDFKLRPRAGVSVGQNYGRVGPYAPEEMAA